MKQEVKSMGLFGSKNNEWKDEWKDILKYPLLTVEGTEFEEYLRDLIRDEMKETRMELHELAKEMGYTKGNWIKRKKD